MAKKQAKPTDPERELSRTVDRLLKNLPFADTPSATTAPNTTPGMRTKPTTLVGTARAIEYSRAGTWLRVTLGLIMAAAITQWPYAKVCGWPLSLYFVAVIAVIGVGVWGGLHTWKARSGIAHLCALSVLVAGLALAGHEILQRTDYTGPAASWRCSLTP